MDQKKTFNKPYSQKPQGLTKKDKADIAACAKFIKLLNKDYIPWAPLTKINPDEMTKIGGRIDKPARFKKDQLVVWRGMKMYVTEIIEPAKNEPHLKAEHQDWGYGLREFNSKKISVYISESEIKTLEDASKHGLLVK